MSVERPPEVTHGSHPDGEPKLDDGVIVASGDLHWLITSVEDVGGQEVQLSEIDNQPGRVRQFQPANPDVEGLAYGEYRYNTLRDARLCYGLLQEVGAYRVPASGDIPRPVAIAGKQAVSSYFRVENMSSRSAVADIMDITEQTVSNHWSRMRWTPRGE